MMGWYKRTFKTRNMMTSQICKACNHTETAIMKELNSIDLRICLLIEEKKSEISIVMKLIEVQLLTYFHSLLVRLLNSRKF